MVVSSGQDTSKGLPGLNEMAQRMRVDGKTQGISKRNEKFCRIRVQQDMGRQEMLKRIIKPKFAKQCFKQIEYYIR